MEEKKSALKVLAVMPAYNAARTIEKTYRDIPRDAVDQVLVVDDASSDETVKVAQELGLEVKVHPQNRGYGANQKTCYDFALESGADIIVMIHPDYQYDSRLIPYYLGFLTSGTLDIILGNRIRTRREALAGGMPIWKYLSNRFLTFLENLVLGQNLGDFHSGFRMYTRKVLLTVPYHNNSDDFVFDSEFLAQSCYFGFKIGDAPMPVRYNPEASSINWKRGVRYGVSTILVMAKYVLQRARMARFAIFESSCSDVSRGKDAQ